MIADYQFIAGHTHALRDTRRSTDRQVASSALRSVLDSILRLVTPMYREQVLSVDISWDDANVEPHDEGAEVLVMETGSTFTATTTNSPRTSYHSFFPLACSLSPVNGTRKHHRQRS